MSMFQAVRSASLTALPKRGLSGSGCTSCGLVTPSGMPVEDFAAIPPPPPDMPAQAARASEHAINVKTCLGLADDIAHLPLSVDRPRLDRVVVLHEAHDRALLGQVL